jgi:hypothetical protein
MADTTDMTGTRSQTAMTSFRALIGRMTPLERVSGRFMRAPDHDEGDDPLADPAAANLPAGPSFDPAPADPPDGGEDASPIESGDEPDAGAFPPETYALIPPEGFSIDEALQAEVDPVFRELGLSNEAANKLMPLAGKFAERIAAAQGDAHQAMATDWARAAKADPELGGARWAETQSLVARALDTFGARQGSEFRMLLDDSRLGNHPEMIRMFRNVGARLGEGGGFVRSDAGAPVKQDRLASLYPEDVPTKEGAN